MLLRRPKRAQAPRPEGWEYDLLLYSNDLILRGSDNGTIVAVTAIALQEIRGQDQPFHKLGSGLLIASIVLCAFMHFCVGMMYRGQAREMIDREDDGESGRPRPHLLRGSVSGLAWILGLLQFATMIGGIWLILADEPPFWVKRFLPGLVAPVVAPEVPGAQADAPAQPTPQPEAKPAGQAAAPEGGADASPAEPER